MLYIPVMPHSPVLMSTLQLSSLSQLLGTFPHPLPPLACCTQPWVTLSLLLSLTLRDLCILCFSLCRSVCVSLTAPSPYIPKPDSCWLSLKIDDRSNITVFFTIFNSLLEGLYMIMLLYLKVLFLHISYWTCESVMSYKLITNVYSLGAYSVTYSPWCYLALLIGWDYMGFPSWGYTGSDTAFEKFLKGFDEEKGKFHFRRKPNVVIQQGIFTKNIFRVTLEKCVCVEISKQQQRLACSVDFTLRRMHQW